MSIPKSKRECDTCAWRPREDIPPYMKPCTEFIMGGYCHHYDSSVEEAINNAIDASTKDGRELLPRDLAPTIPIPRSVLPGIYVDDTDFKAAAAKADSLLRNMGRGFASVGTSASEACEAILVATRTMCPKPRKKKPNNQVKDRHGFGDKKRKKNTDHLNWR